MREQLKLVMVAVIVLLFSTIIITTSWLRGSARPLHESELKINPNEIGGKQGPYIVASTYEGTFGAYKLKHRITNAGRNVVRVEYLSAFFIHPKVAPNSTEDLEVDALYPPIHFDKSFFPSVDYSVKIFPDRIFFDAPAYAPALSILTEIGKELKNILKGGLTLRVKVTIGAKSAEETVEFESTMKPEPDGKRTYTYEVRTNARRGIYFQWTSALAPGTRLGLRDKATEWEKYRSSYTESGESVVIQDIAIFNTESFGNLSTLESLVKHSTLSARLENLRRSISDRDINFVVLAPAIVPESWLRGR